MRKIIVLAGATGNLGGKIVKAGVMDICGVFLETLCSSGQKWWSLF